jgi:hypothetical protein
MYGDVINTITSIKYKYSSELSCRTRTNHSVEFVA